MEFTTNEIIKYGTHQFINEFLNSFLFLKLFIISFIVNFFISKKISKKTFKFNNICYLLLTISYLIVSIIQAYTISKLPPHNLLKDMCGLNYTIIQIVIAYHTPIIYTILLFAKLIDKNLKKKKENK